MNTDTNTNTSTVVALHWVLVEDNAEFTLFELSRACRAEVQQVVALVDEGVLVPSGEHPQEWRFAGATLRRARVALRLTRDLELNAPGVAFALDLLEEIEMLKSRLRRLHH